MSDRVLTVDNIVKHYHVGGGLLGRGEPPVQALAGVSLHLDSAETLSVVGESGCGKTTLTKVVLNLERPTAGQVRLGPDDGSGTVVQAVFQDPSSSLNPRMRVDALVSEPLSIKHRIGRSRANQLVGELLETVGLNASFMRRYPHELSGGQRQRVAIARALSVDPELIVLDEPVSALDVSIRAQIINLLGDIQDRLGTAYLMISHDLSTVRHLSHRVAVMYLGKIVEEGPVEQIFQDPQHPYTRALLSASLPMRPGVKRSRIILHGEIPSPADPPSGCRFRTRCPHAFERCANEVPEPHQSGSHHSVACHLPPS